MLSTCILEQSDHSGLTKLESPRMLTAAFGKIAKFLGPFILAAWLTNWTVLLVADLVFCHITNAVLASKLGCGVVAEPATFLYPSSTGDGTDVPW